MDPTKPDFCDSLLEAEPLDPQRQQRFDRQVRDLADRRITGIQWVYWMFFLIGCCLSDYFWGRSILMLPRQQAPSHAGPGPGVFLMGIWACFLLSTLATLLVLYFLVRRRVDLRIQLWFGRFMPAGAFALVILSFLYGCDDPGHKPEATWLGVYALAAFVFVSSINLWNRIVASDHHAQERLLRIEYRLAELSERLPSPDQKPK